MSACLFYVPEAYSTAGPKLMGRNAAGESFLRGFLIHSQATEFWAQVQQPAHARHFADTVAAFGRQEPVKAVDKNNLAALAQKTQARNTLGVDGHGLGRPLHGPPVFPRQGAPTGHVAGDGSGESERQAFVFRSLAWLVKLGVLKVCA